MSTQLLIGSDAIAEAAVTTDGFDQLQKQILESRRKIWPARSFYPSSIGHPCDRLIVWRFNRSDEQEPHDYVLQSIFDQGREEQPIFYRRLEEIGFDIVRESDRPTQYKVGRAVISGRPDGRVIGFRAHRFKPALALEAKHLAGHAWDAIRTADDIKHAPTYWTRAYYVQGQLYCFLENLPRGIFALRSKATGLIKVIPYELDYAYAERILQRVEQLQPLIEQGVDPDPIPFDLQICGGCGFRKICYPPKNFGEGATVIDDLALIEQMERREALHPASKEYAQVDKAIKDRLKHEGTKFAIVGPFVVEGKLVPKKEYKVAAHEEIHYTIVRG